MFRIIAGGIQQSYSEIEKQIARRQALITEVGEVVKNLNSFSGMEEVTEILKQKIRVLETEQRTFIQMLQALNLVLTYHEECERRIVSNCELGDRWSFKVSFKKNDFSSIADELKNITLK